MRQPDHEYEERSFGDIQRAIDFENSMNDLESQLYYQHLSPKEVAQQVLKATCQFYDADWCGLIQVDLDLNLWTPFWWFNAGATDKTMLLTEEYESAEFLDRWVQTVRKGIPMVVPDAEATKEAYPAEYNLYQRLGIRSVIAVSLEPRPVALLAVRNPKRYIQQTSMLRILAYVLLASYNEQKMLNRLQMAYSERAYVDNTQPIFVTEDDEDSVDFKRYEKAITVTDVYHETKNRFAWVGEIKNEHLLAALEKLNAKDLELLTLFAYEGYTVTEISKVLHCSQPTISIKIKRITKFLKNFEFDAMD